MNFLSTVEMFWDILSSMSCYVRQTINVRSQVTKMYSLSASYNPWALNQACSGGMYDHTGASDNSNSIWHHSDITNGRNIDLLLGNAECESHWQGRDSDPQTCSQSESFGQPERESTWFTLTGTLQLHETTVTSTLSTILNICIHRFQSLHKVGCNNYIILLPPQDRPAWITQVSSSYLEHHLKINEFYFLLSLLAETSNLKTNNPLTQVSKLYC